MVQSPRSLRGVPRLSLLYINSQMTCTCIFGSMCRCHVINTYNMCQLQEQIIHEATAAAAAAPAWWWWDQCMGCPSSAWHVLAVLGPSLTHNTSSCMDEKCTYKLFRLRRTPRIVKLIPQGTLLLSGQYFKMKNA